jgi:hypothetical protein
MEGYLGDVEVHRVRRVEVLVLARKGQDALKRDREESLSIVSVDERLIVRGTGRIIDCHFYGAEDLFPVIIEEPLIGW